MDPENRWAPLGSARLRCAIVPDDLRVLPFRHGLERDRTPTSTHSSKSARREDATRRVGEPGRDCRPGGALPFSAARPNSCHQWLAGWRLRTSW